MPRSIAMMRPCSTPISNGPSDRRSKRRALRMMRSTILHSREDLSRFVGASRRSALAVQGRSIGRRSRTDHPRVSLGLNVGCLDQWPPLFDFGLVVSGERLRRLLLARWDLLTEAGEALADGRNGEGIQGWGRQASKGLPPAF